MAQHQNHIHVNVFLDILVIFVINQSDHQEQHVTYQTDVKMVENVFHQSDRARNISVNVQLVTLVIIAKLNNRK